MGFVIHSPSGTMAAIKTDCITEALSEASILLGIPTYRLGGFEFTSNVEEAARWWEANTGNPVVWGC
jgi:hypothetical protein